MPIFKYFVVVGIALFGLIFALEAVTMPNIPAQLSTDQKAVAAASTSRSSIALLRAMSHHGDNSRSAMAADAGPMLPMPLVAGTTLAEATPDRAEAKSAIVSLPTIALDAQARMSSDDVVKPKPAKKRIAARRSQYPNRYVENTQRGPFDFFGAVQSW